MSYSAFFEHLTGRTPFPYQERLGTEPWPELLDVPTGLGKTAAAVVAWLYKRLQGDPETGMRLVYCLPMRVLVEQTQAAARQWCDRAASHFEQRQIATPTVHVLMGGDVDEEWENHPERPAIVIGTQDMLLSRALNRGYALSRYKWPVHFALLNNDCLWVFDETQLIGVGIETSAQLQGFRQKLGTHRAAHSLWMSATLGEQQLDTVDHRKPEAGWRVHSLRSQDLCEKLVQTRVGASKPIAASPLKLDKDNDGQPYAKALADHVIKEHAQRGGLTLVILNRVSRAQQVYQALRSSDGRTDENTALVHSRFRASDRQREEAILQHSDQDRIVVATQAIEAGVDVSSRTLFTELAPWPSLVQRLGRCNRYGGETAAVFWVDIDTDHEKHGVCLPYERTELDRARELLGSLVSGGGDAGPQSLKEIEYQPPRVVRPVIRRRDLLDLFDTTPDLSGNDIDIARYVRDGEDTDVQVYWRNFSEATPNDELGQPERGELCRVSIAALRTFLKNLDRLRKRLAGGSEDDRRRAARLQAFVWNPLDKQWQATAQAFSGQVLLLHSSAGGYDPRLGWTGDVGPKQEVPVVEPGETAPTDSEGYASDPDTVLGRWVTLTDHLGHVRDEAALLAKATGQKDFVETLATAGLWHDVGKAHEAFQQKLLAPLEARPELKPQGSGPWAKSNHRLKSPDLRKHFRHELASALAWLAASDDVDRQQRDLVAYLVAAHHGKVRLSLRSLPGESEPREPGRLFARGVWDGDTLPAFRLPDGRSFENLALDLSLMQLGEGSWLERMLELRDAAHLGPFRLALLETLVRIADWRASRKEQEGAYDA